MRILDERVKYLSPHRKERQKRQECEQLVRRAL